MKIQIQEFNQWNKGLLVLCVTVIIIVVISAICYIVRPEYTITILFDASERGLEAVTLMTLNLTAMK